jgi:hypothetical protein
MVEILGMKFEEVLPAFREGKKIRRDAWDEKDYVVINGGFELSDRSIMANDWEIVPEPKKPKLLAPCLCKSVGNIWISNKIYESKEAAINDIGTTYFISWPAVPNAEGFYTVGDV